MLRDSAHDCTVQCRLCEAMPPTFRICESNSNMKAIISRPELKLGKEILSESRWREFLDEVRVYSEKIEREKYAHCAITVSFCWLLSI